MSTMREAEVTARLRSYVAGDESLEEFADWFAPVLFEERGPGTDLLGSVALCLAEFSSGHLTEKDLRDEFARLIGAHARA